MEKSIVINYFFSISRFSSIFLDTLATCSVLSEGTLHEALNSIGKSILTRGKENNSITGWNPMRASKVFPWTRTIFVIRRYCQSGVAVASLFKSRRNLLDDSSITLLNGFLTIDPRTTCFDLRWSFPFSSILLYHCYIVQLFRNWTCALWRFLASSKIDAVLRCGILVSTCGIHSVQNILFRRCQCIVCSLLQIHLISATLRHYPPSD